MVPIGASELALGRTDAALTLPDTCTLTREQDIPDGSGGTTHTTTTTTNIPARLDTAPTGTAREVEENGRTVAVQEWVVVLPYSIDVQPRDRITINGLTLEVVEDNGALSELLLQTVRVRVAQ